MGTHRTTTGTIDPQALYNSAEVARLAFRRRRRWFYAHRARLHAEEGFPPPVSAIGRPLWRGQALIDWLARPRRAALPANDDSPAGDPCADFRLRGRILEAVQ